MKNYFLVMMSIAILYGNAVHAGRLGYEYDEETPAPEELDARALYHNIWGKIVKIRTIDVELIVPFTLEERKRIICATIAEIEEQIAILSKNHRVNRDYRVTKREIKTLKRCVLTCKNYYYEENRSVVPV